MALYKTIVIGLFASIGFASSVAASTTQYTGTITSGADFDLYTMSIQRGAFVIATLVCDEDPGVPGSRPLDPVLSAYFPGSDPSDTINADVYNDDGFGSDDSPLGVDCDAFDSARITFTALTDGVFTFRVDGFGSSTGPYTLNIIVVDAIGVPALDRRGLALAVAMLAGVALFQFRRLRA